MTLDKPELKGFHASIILYKSLMARAEILIDGISSLLEKGDVIIIPAHSLNSINAIERFKMISTIIKSGYEEVIKSSNEIVRQ